MSTVLSKPPVVSIGDIESGAVFDKPIVLLVGSHTLELFAFKNLGTAALHEQLLRKILDAADKLAKGELAGVIYERPFRMIGWTFYEILYRLLIKPFQWRMRWVGVHRRIRHVFVGKVPKSVECFEPMRRLRKKYPQRFHTLTRIAVRQLWEHLRDPKGEYGKGVADFASGISCIPDATVREAEHQVYAEGIEEALLRLKPGRVRVFSAAEDSAALVQYFLGKGGRIII